MPNRFDPLAELDRLARAVGQLIGRSPAVAVTRSDAELRLTVDLPGVKAEDIDLSVDGSGVVVRGVRRPVESSAGSEAAGEPAGGAREIELRHELDPTEPVDVAGATASFEDGVLTVRLPRATGSRARRIDVRHAGQAAASPGPGDASDGGEHGGGSGTAPGIVPPPPEEQGNPLPTS